MEGFQQNLAQLFIIWVEIAVKVLGLEVIVSGDSELKKILCVTRYLCMRGISMKHATDVHHGIAVKFLRS